MNIIDTVIVGGGLSGLSAALLLGRCTRKVLVFDDGKYRNYAAQHVNGFITQDNLSPEELRDKGRKDVLNYDVNIINSHVENIKQENNYFIVEYDAYTVKAKTIILATGLKDQLPELEGLNKVYGKKVFLCPYCDAFEYKDKAIAVHGKNGATLCLILKTWTKEGITWFSEEEPSKEDKEKLENKDIRIVSEKVKTLFVNNYNDLEVVFGLNSLRFDAMFLSLTKGQKQRSTLAEKLGLKVTKENGIEVNEKCETEIKGIWAIGDSTKDRLLVIKGVAESVDAAISVNTYLRENWDE